MRRLVPPLNPLRTFEVAARHVSFTRAAEELGVTQTAVSRQVAVLESFLKTRLFERRHSELVLTDSGRAYLQSIQPAFDMIAYATEATRRHVPSSLNIRAYLTFAMRWLVPRLPRFRALHPTIGINLTTSTMQADFEREDLDIAICHGSGQWPGVSAWRIFDDSITPVCAPSLAEKLHSPADLARQTLLHSRNRRGDWPGWLNFAGIGEQDGADSLVFETSMLTYEAARQGLGVAIGQHCLIEEDLRQGALIAPFPRYERPMGYYLLHRERGRLEPKVNAFRQWLLREAGVSVKA